MDFESLRRRAAELEAQRQSQQESRRLQEALRRQQAEKEKRWKEQIEAAKEKSRRYMEASNFPRLIYDLGTLLYGTDSGGLNIYPHTIPELDFKIGSTYIENEWFHQEMARYKLPFSFGIMNDYYSVSIALTGKHGEKLESLRWRKRNKPGILTNIFKSHLVEVSSLPEMKGFAVEATPTGQIITHGARSKTLSLEEWEGNKRIQQQEVERIFNNPFKLICAIETDSWPYEDPDPMPGLGL